MAEHQDLLERLTRNRVECVLVGGYAAVIHGVSLVTKDVDVCTHFSRENLERIFAAVSDLHPYHSITPQPLPFEIPPGFETRINNLDIGTDLGRVDFLGDVAGIGGYAASLEQSIPLQLPFGTVRMLSRKALIKAKSAMDRPHDKVTVMQLLAIEERDAPEPR
ncbi:MAG: hypothetical protein ABMA13_15610 [Chthoniobacteraceae bacterium]